MKGRITYSIRRLSGWLVFLLIALTGMEAQNSNPVPSISLPGSQRSDFTGSEAPMENDA